MVRTFGFILERLDIRSVPGDGQDSPFCLRDHTNRHRGWVKCKPGPLNDTCQSLLIHAAPIRISGTV